jgi:hypothetical protein
MLIDPTFPAWPGRFGGWKMVRSRGLVVVLSTLIGCATGAVSADYSVTDLVDAAKRGDGHAVHRLIADGADLEVRGPMGCTALHWAAIRGNWRIFSDLVAAGASANAVGGDGDSPLHWACHHDRADMIALLLDTGADVNLQNRSGWTPLHVAARRGCDGVAGLLLDRGADLEAVTAEGWTPLHVACLSDHPSVELLLLSRGAHPEKLDNNGLTPVGSRRARPTRIEIDPVVLGDYEGNFDLGGGLTAKVWREGDGLRIRELAPDDLYPVAVDTFFCVREPWEVKFHRDIQGGVDSMQIDFLRSTVNAVRIPSPRYLGSRACMNCHERQYVSWLQSRHAHAYWRLGADWALYLGRMRPQYQDLTDPMTDQRCTLCHVTGAQNDNSLFAATFRPEEGVSCESCHGPGSNYIDPEIMADRGKFLAAGGRVPDDATCRSCHRNSDRFDWAEWWTKIAHPSPEPAPGTGS